jgi:Ca2+-transporting ATPase
MEWHSKDISEVLEHFNTDSEAGLKDEQVIDLREKFGENILTAKKNKSDFILLLEQFNDPIIYMLIIAAIFNAIYSDFKDTIVIVSVVILNTLIGFFQERRAADALKTLSKMAAPIARIIRNGEQLLIPSAEVVCGDLVVLESGMKVPADGRLIDTNSLLIDESMLTGESFAIGKKHNTKLPNDASLGDRINIVHAGTIIQKGRGTAVVTEVGKGTEFGKISEKVAEAIESQSPLQHQIKKFGNGLIYGILAIVIAIFIVGFLRGNEWISMFLTSVALAVSAIPEGLPVAITITLTIGISQMAKHNAVVKKLSAVETLGSTNVICTDKTGTLTKNQMTVTSLWTGCNEFKVYGSGYSKVGSVFSIDQNKTVSYKDNQSLLLTALLVNTCTESSISLEGDAWKITGDPTEAALMILSDKLNLDDLSFQILVDIPFESENQFMAVRALSAVDSYVFAKGAPEKILARCSNILNCDGTTGELDPELLNSVISSLSKDGLRIIAMAYSRENTNKTLSIENINNLTFLGFAGIEDSVRPEAVEAVAECRSAGIKVVMITGDHIKTAQAVAMAVGIGIDKEVPIAIDGKHLDDMTDDELFQQVPDIDVYARVAPHHKFRIVQQLQKHNNIVAMTGDGVNDAPALKQADIGVSMGTGTDVARDASHMVLMDDNFATIVHAVRRGRIILHNLQHILLYILATSFGGLLTIAMSVAFGFPLPILPAQLLWINLVTDGTSTFPLAFEKEHGNVMAFPPRKKNKPLISRRMIWRILYAGFVMMLGTLSVFYMFLDNFSDPSPESLAQARTMAFCILAFFQIWNVQNSRSLDRSILFNLPFSNNNSYDKVSPLKNPILLGIMILAIGLQLMAVTIPFMNLLMDTVPLSLNNWLIVASVSFSIIIFVELEKYIRAINYRHKRDKHGIEINFESE